MGDAFVRGAGDFAIAALVVKAAGTGGGVEGVETDRIGGPEFGDAAGIFQGLAADAGALEGRGDGHGGEIEGRATGVKYFLSIAQGLRLERAREAMILLRRRAMNTVVIFMEKAVPRSVLSRFQGSLPNCE